MHHLVRSQLDMSSRLHLWMGPTASGSAPSAVQHASPVLAPAAGGTRQRRRRRSELTEQLEPDHSFNSTSFRGRAQHRPGAPVLLYIPIKCEAEAVQLCAQAGYTLTHVQNQQQELSAQIVAEAMAACTEQWPVAADGDAMPQHSGMPAQTATALRTTATIMPQQQQQQQQQQEPSTQRQTVSKQQQRQHIELDIPVQSKSAAASGQNNTTAAPAQPAAPRAPWQLAVDNRVQQAASSHGASVSMARYSKWRGGASPTPRSRMPSAVPPRHGSSSSSSEVSERFMPELQRGGSTCSAAAFEQKYGSGQQLSPKAEAELCVMYQRYVTLDQVVRAELQKYQQQQPHGSLHLMQAGSAAALPPQLDDAAEVEVQGRMAQELLLELYRPLIYKRANAAAQRARGSDHGELVAAARHAVLHAASKFDAARAAANNARLAMLADMYVRNALKAVLYEYQSGAVSLPAHVTDLQRKLRLIEDRHQRLYHSKPSTRELAAAAGVSVLQVERALAAAALQSSGLADVGGGDDHSEQLGSAINLQLLDTTESYEELDSVIAHGAVKAARSGLQEEQEQAAEAELLASVMQQYLMTLSERDRSLLALRIGIRLPASTSSNTAIGADALAGQGSRDDTQRKGCISDRQMAAGAGHNSSTAAVQLQDLIVEEQSMSLEELAKHFNVKSRQRAHQLMEGAVKQLRQQLQQAAEQDAQVAQLLAGSQLSI